MTPFFSIVVPVYNVAPFLKEALDSVVAQTFTDWECICVDDGSTDGSSAILDAYAACDARFKVVHQANQGVSAARNVALGLAQGAYLSFLDGDDILLPQRLEVAHRLLTTHQVDLIHFKISEWETGVAAHYIPSERGICLTDMCTIRNWGIPHILAQGWTPQLFIRNTAWLKECRFPVGLVMREDNIFALQILKHCERVFIGEDCGYRYRQRLKSATHTTRTTPDAIQFLHVLQPLADFYGAPYRDYFNEAIARDCSGWVRFRCWHKTSKDEIDAYHQAVRKFLPEENEFPSYTPFYLYWCGFAFWKWKALWPARIIQALLLVQYHLKPHAWRNRSAYFCKK